MIDEQVLAEIERRLEDCDIPPGDSHCPGCYRADEVISVLVAEVRRLRALGRAYVPSVPR